MSGLCEAKDTLRWRGGHVSAQVSCVLAPNPSPLTYYGTNTWIVSSVEHNACVVVDPGPSDSVHLNRVLAVCADDCLPIGAILLTHDHYDHAGGADMLSEMSGAPVLARRNATLPDGPLPLQGLEGMVSTLSLPGHSGDSVGFFAPESRVLITGDAIFAQSSTVICWPDGDLDSYLGTLHNLASFVIENQVEAFLTGHGIPIQDPLERIAQCRRHRMQRLNQVVAAVRSGIPARAENIVEAIYNDVEVNLHDMAILSVTAQLNYAFERGLLEEHRSESILT